MLDRMLDQARTETLEWRRPATGDGLQLLSGTLSKEPFPAMVVDSFLVGYYVQGSTELLHRGRKIPVTGNMACLYEPGELVRSGVRSSELGVFHCALAPRAAIDRAAVDIRDDARAEGFGLRLFGAEVAEAVQRFADAVVQNAPPMEQESDWLEVVALLLGSGGDVGDPPRVAARQVRHAREYLHAHVHGTVSLEDLASAVSASKYHLVHAFHRAVGMPPHRYHLLLRLGRARELLAEGVSQADVAIALGFSDQSHLSRAFKRAFGITPGAWTSLFAR
ncbi:MAG TPA: AraC family transcriptional regulator [Polyangia bacterium]|nr:AraC family transcriptional regulator [Polyangia bacterium]